MRACKRCNGHGAKDIDEVDLQQLFEMIDVDGSGCIELNEFVVPFSRWAPLEAFEEIQSA